MVLCGVVCVYVVLCGVVWCCVVLCGAVWCCVVLCGVEKSIFYDKNKGTFTYVIK